MKKLLLILLCALPLIAQTHNVNSDTSIASINGIDTANIASINEVAWLGYAAGGGGCSLSVVSSSGNTANEGGTLANGSAVAWVGNDLNPNDTTYNIDAVEIYIHSINGNVDSIDYVAEIYTHASDGFDLAVQVGSTSDVVSGLTASAWNLFEFPSTISLPDTATYGYCIIFRRDDFFYNATHYADITYGTTDWSGIKGETTRYVEGTSALAATGYHATIEYTIRWSECD